MRRGRAETHVLAVGFYILMVIIKVLADAFDQQVEQGDETSYPVSSQEPQSEGHESSSFFSS